MLPAPVDLPPAPARPRRRRAGRRALVAAALGLLLAGCSTNHGPKNFDDAKVQENFFTSCRTSNGEKKDTVDTQQFCDCLWTKVKETYTFDEFKTLDEKLRDALADEATAPKTAADLNKIDTRYVGVVDQCRTSGPSVPSSNAGTTTTVATTTTAK